MCYNFLSEIIYRSKALNGDILTRPSSTEVASMENIFHVLGGGSSIGNSSYYLQMDDCRFLLDCGASFVRGRWALPDPETPMRRYVERPDDLSAVVVSHAHGDHIAALPYLADMGLTQPIYCNPITIELMRVYFCEIHRLEQHLSEGLQKIMALRKDQCLDLCTPLPFGRTMTGAGWKLTQYPAGHIPGAAMTYLETARHRVLFTGDFSCQEELLCGAYRLPKELPVDLLIVEGTLAQRSRAGTYGYYYIERDAYRALCTRGKAIIEVSELTKGIELARALAAIRRARGREYFRIFLAQEVVPVADAFERARFQVYSEQIRPLPRGGVPEGALIRRGATTTARRHCCSTTLCAIPIRRSGRVHAGWSSMMSAPSRRFATMG